jgi:hypothetical protein
VFSMDLQQILCHCNPLQTILHSVGSNFPKSSMPYLLSSYFAGRHGLQNGHASCLQCILNLPLLPQQHAEEWLQWNIGLTSSGQLAPSKTVHGWMRRCISHPAISRTSSPAAAEHSKYIVHTPFIQCKPSPGLQNWQPSLLHSRDNHPSHPHTLKCSWNEFLASRSDSSSTQTTGGRRRASAPIR